MYKYVSDKATLFQDAMRAAARDKRLATPCSERNGRLSSMWPAQAMKPRSTGTTCRPPGTTAVPAGPLSAFSMYDELGIHNGLFASGPAARLAAITGTLI
jgi:hypothetical protein